MGNGNGKRALTLVKGWGGPFGLGLALLALFGFYLITPARRMEAVEASVALNLRNDSIYRANAHTSYAEIYYLVTAMARVECIDARSRGPQRLDQLQAAGVPCTRLLDGYAQP
jgi:hypothetical protein